MKDRKQNRRSRNLYFALVVIFILGSGLFLYLSAKYFFLDGEVKSKDKIINKTKWEISDLRSALLDVNEENERLKKRLDSSQLMSRQFEKRYDSVRVLIANVRKELEGFERSYLHLSDSAKVEKIKAILK